MSKRVYLVGQSVMNYDEVCHLLEDMGVKNNPFTEVSDEERDVDFLPELGGRLCYMSFDNPRPGGNRAYLSHIKEVGHGSVFEHSVFNFVLIGVSRTFTHELVRHRVGTAYSQLSQRYVDESNGTNVIPEALLDVADLETASGETVGFKISTLIDDSRELYSELVDLLSKKGLDRKSARGAARSVLLGGNSTKIMFTVNARELRHIFDLRGSKHAEAEIRSVTIEIYELVKHLELFSDYRVEDGCLVKG